jgi:nucleoside-diphosphate-sugar epimerase
MSVLEKGSTVLVTGVNGYIASHIAVQLIKAGYRVRGSVRSREKAQW